MSMTKNKVTFKNATQLANEVLKNAVRGICDVILCDGNFNVDFADVRTTMSIPGLALMGIGRANGENRAREAAQQALMSPLLEDVSLESAKAILYNITASSSLTMEEVSEIGFMIHDINNDPNINIIFGVTYDEDMDDDLQLTLIATGIEPQAAVEEDVEKLAPARANVTNFRESVGAARRQEPRQQFPPAEQEPEQAAAPAPRRQPSPAAWQVAREARTAAFSAQNEYAAQQYPMHNPGKEAKIYDPNGDWEIPAFLRQQAD